MKKHTILKSIALLLCWLTLSPLLLILDSRWKLLPKWLRVVLFLVSPMMVIIIVMAVMFVDYIAVDRFHRYHFTKPKAIERITGVVFPKYEIVDYNDQTHGHGPRHYDTELEFEAVPDEAFYKALEKHGVSYFDNDSVRTFSFKKTYRYLSIGYIGIYDLVIYGGAHIEVKEGSKNFKVSLFEWPDKNGFMKGEYDDTRDIEAEMAALMAKPCSLIETDSLNVYFPYQHPYCTNWVAFYR